MSFKKLAQAFAASEQGMELVEWAVFAGLMAAITVSGLMAFRDAVSDRLAGIGQVINSL